MKDFFCKICMYYRTCNNSCSCNSPNKNIYWINLNNFSDKILTENNNTNFETLNDLSLINTFHEYSTIYAPLLGRIFLISNKIIDSKNDKIIFNLKFRKELLESGLLISKKNLEYLNLILSPNYSASSSLKIAFSSGCSLNCSYCYANANHKNIKININKLLLLINKLPLNLKNVYLHGNGEPTYNFRELQQVVKLIKEKYPNIIFHIQTNGQFDENTLDWLLSNNINISFSIDGPKFIHNKQRPSINNNISSYNQVINNIFNIKKYGLNPSVITTISSYSVNKLEIIYNFFKSLNCKEIKMNPIINAGKSNYSKYKQYVYNTSPNLNIFSDKYSNILIESIKDKINLSSSLLQLLSKGPSMTYCRAHKPEIIFLPNGYLTACCESLQEINIKNNLFVFAKCYENDIGIKIENIETLRKRTITNIISCQNCFLKWLCSGGCMAESYLRYNDIFKVVEEQCDARKRIMNNLFSFLSNEMIEKYLT
jgi:radical SAM protein with 4Fe4S-binding SPASM domain